MFQDWDLRELLTCIPAAPFDMQCKNWRHRRLQIRTAILLTHLVDSLRSRVATLVHDHDLFPRRQAGRFLNVNVYFLKWQMYEIRVS